MKVVLQTKFPSLRMEAECATLRAPLNLSPAFRKFLKTTLAGSADQRSPLSESRQSREEVFFHDLPDVLAST